MTAGVWSIRGALAPRIDQTWLVGAAVGLVLVGALAALVVTTDTFLGNSVGWLIWLVLYPLSPLLGHDLATGGATAPDGPLLRAGGYCVVDLEGRSPLWVILLALCRRGRAGGAGAVRAARGLRGGGWALIGVALFILLSAWIVYFVAIGVWFARIDS